LLLRLKAGELAGIFSGVMEVMLVIERWSRR
jgi:hypothetical protein